MIKEKDVPLITVIALFLAVILTIGILYGKESKEHATIQEPAYVSQVFDKSKVLQIDIVMDKEVWKNMLDNAINEAYYPADIIVNGEKYDTVGIRPKGNSSLSMVAMDETTDRFSFKLDFGKYIKDQSLQGLSKIALNNMIGDTTYMKEYFSYEIMTIMGINTPAYAYANLTLNGKPWGLYLAVEVMEEEFLQRYYGNDYGNLYKPETMEMGGEKKMMNPGDRPDMKDRGGMPDMKGIPNMEDISNLEEIPNEKKIQGMKETPSMEGASGMKDVSNMDNALDMKDIPSIENMPEMKDVANRGNTVDKEGTTNRGNTLGIEGIPNMENIPGKEGMPNMKGMPGGPDGSENSETNLVYIDDNLESYSGIFENTITKKTTKLEQKKMVEMIKNLNEGTDLEKCLDVDQILRYFAANTFLVNLDSYAGPMKHNYYLYEEDGRVQILPWDFNLSFAGFQVNDASKAINFPIDAPVTDTLENSPLIAKLLENEEYKEKYHQYLSQIVDEYINSGVFEEEVYQLDNLIKNYVKQDQTAFYTYEEYQASLSQLILFAKDRAESITLQLLGEQPSTNYGDVQTQVNLQALGTMGRGANQQDPDEAFKMPIGEEKRSLLENRQQGILGNNEMQQIYTMGICLGAMLIGSIYVKIFKRKKQI